jgi:hypothetical protein
MKIKLNLIIFLIGTFFLLNDCRKSDYNIDEESVIRDLGQGTGTITWIREKHYILEGLVFVNDGQVLTIEAGTVIRARTGQGTASSALIVARGGRIMAEGTPSDPIIFTCEGDDLKGSVPVKARGLWGGIILLGNARLNSVYNENSIEGMPVSEENRIFGEYFSLADNTVTDPGIEYTDNQYQLVPRNIIFTRLASYPSEWFESVNFKGAFGTFNWAWDWTLLSQSGFLTD